MKTTRLTTQLCPFCGHTLDAATAGPIHPEATPRADDVTLCIECGNVLIFADDLSVRKPTPDELAECLMLPEVWHGRAAILEARRRAPFSRMGSKH